MYYSEEVLEEVRSKNDIVEVIGSYVRLQKKGASYFGLCPFHNEKSPSFSVSPSKQMYYCFGCGAGGNVFTFLQQYENYSFQEAVKVLADRAGVQLPETEMTAADKQRESRRMQLLEVSREAAKYFYYQLRMPQGKDGLAYLQGRALTEETIHKWGLGYSNKTSNDLVQYLHQKGYKDDLIMEAGLATFDERYGMHDKFWNRVMFPIQDSNHRVIGFGGRVMGDGKPKYLNSPETPIFDKSRNLFGLNFARSSRKNQFILCEGYMDVITMHQAGFTQAVASLGTAFTSGQANLLRRYADEVLLAYDSDEAGIKAALRAIGILKEVGLTGKVLHFDPHKDPDEFIKTEGAEAFQKRIDEAENSFLFEIRILQRDYSMSDPESKTKFFREVAKKLCLFSEDLERNNYMEAVARKFGIGFDELKSLVRSYATQTGLAKPLERPKSGIHQKNTPEESIKRSQRLLITWIANEPAIYEKIKKYISATDFTEPLYSEVADKLFREIEAGEMNLAAMVSQFTEEEQQKEVAALFNTELEALEEDTAGREQAFHDILYAVKKNSYEYFSANLGSDVSALEKVINGKQALEELSRTHISLES
ncbi:MAG: DNA primase [Lachnospiraceae bacterium]|nr:DNA primase [Lachnospiraceae bacterium]